MKGQERTSFLPPLRVPPGISRPNFVLLAAAAVRCTHETCTQVRFAMDSAVEGDGFELPVPRKLGPRRGRRLGLHLGSLNAPAARPRLERDQAAPGFGEEGEHCRRVIKRRATASKARPELGALLGLKRYASVPLTPFFELGEGNPHVPRADVHRASPNCRSRPKALVPKADSGGPRYASTSSAKLRP